MYKQAVQKAPSPQKLQEQNETTLDEHFMLIMLQIEKKYQKFSRHEKVRIENWTKKLCSITANSTWKKNRNMHAILLLDCVMKGQLTGPFVKGPPEGGLPAMQKFQITNKALLSDKFYEQMQHEMLMEQNNEQFQQEQEQPEMYSTPEKEKIMAQQLSAIAKVQEAPSQTNQDWIRLLAEAQQQQQKQRIQNQNQNQSVLSTTMINQQPGSQQDKKELIKLQTQLKISKANERELKNELQIRQKQIGLMQTTVDDLTSRVNELDAKNSHLLNILLMSIQFFQNNAHSIKNTPDVILFNKIINELTTISLQSQNIGMPEDNNYMDQEEMMMIDEVNMQQQQLQQQQQKQLPMTLPNDEDSYMRYLQNYEQKTAKLKREASEFLQFQENLSGGQQFNNYNNNNNNMYN